VPGIVKRKKREYLILQPYTLGTLGRFAMMLSLTAFLVSLTVGQWDSKVT
jgi:hypothetical protein